MLNDKVAVVTGSSRGIGAAIAQELARNGAKVVVNYTANREQQMHEAIAAHTPLRRLAEASDISGAVLFFCSDQARHVTGTYLPVCGGSQMT